MTQFEKIDSYVVVYISFLDFHRKVFTQHNSNVANGIYLRENEEFM
jgi:hypothetical protein